GTALENDADGSALWAAACVQNAPDKVVEVHRRFLTAGARIIETSTYQVARATGVRAGFDGQQTEQIMCSAVKLADEARKAFYESGEALSTDPRDSRGASPSGAVSSASAQVEVALSLGPYGATLVPSCEFSGVYPPPFGPPAEEAAAEDALASWHLQRLRVYARHDDVWAKINILAFETIPLLREIRAVRRAMHTLLAELNNPAAGNAHPVTPVGGSPAPATPVHKDWWISCTFPAPEGRFPDPTVPATVTLADVVRAVFDHGDGLAIPTGIGINCTPASLLPRLTQELCHAFRHHHSPNEKYLPWIVLYPNGGTYSEEHACWMANDTPAWCNALAECVRICDAEFGVREPRPASSSSPGSFRISRVIIGGCCNTGPVDISALAQAFHLEREPEMQSTRGAYVTRPGNAVY
ncbi:Homocysteine S-methyltransferase, partial [Auricularia subglabra TFB-10046 SS5]